MKRAVYCFLIFLLGILVSCAPKSDQSLPAQPTPTSAGPAKGFDIKVTSLERASERRPTSKGIKALLIVPGAELVLGQGYVANRGFELAILQLSVRRVADGVPLSMENPLLFDDKGQSYQSVYSYLPLGQEASETRELMFPVKKGTALKKIQLTPGISFDLP